MEKMFCFQCEQTMKNESCTTKGVCGKDYETSNLQDELISNLIALTKAVECSNRDEQTDSLIVDGLFTTVTNVNFDENTLKDFISNIKNKINEIIDDCGCYDTTDIYYDLSNIWNDNEDIRSLKSLILFGLKGVAAYAHHAFNLGFKNDTVMDFFYEALSDLSKNLSADELLPKVLKTGEINLIVMQLLDEANTSSYGNPEPTKVSLTIEKGPFIVVSGHDLHDLYCLLEQTKGKGINIYTHSEMLPACSYPKLKAYPHLKGNFGTAWQNQQKEFANIKGAVLFTTNCLMPVRDSYKDRVFTTSVVRYPELVHVTNKDFSPVINKALELKGNDEDLKLTGINGGEYVLTGFGHNTVLSVADKVIEGVKNGQIGHFFLVGGCDGAKPGRNYYTDFVKKTPSDSIILTIACGKYRFNDLDLNEVCGLPRIMDMGQCNDAYSAIRVAVALSEAFNCSVNELPLTLVLSWYEQKAVAILLTLLHLGIKNILIGPSLPAFISKNVLNILVENYNLMPTTSPEDDLKRILKLNK